jgi:hypothetical protein
LENWLWMDSWTDLGLGVRLASLRLLLL